VLKSGKYYPFTAADMLLFINITLPNITGFVDARSFSSHLSRFWTALVVSQVLITALILLLFGL